MEVVLAEYWAVEADSVEDAIDKAVKATRKDSVIVGSDSLRTAFHPVHLAETQAKFGHIEPPAVEEE